MTFPNTTPRPDQDLLDALSRDWTGMADDQERQIERAVAQFAHKIAAWLQPSAALSQFLQALRPLRDDLVAEARKQARASGPTRGLQEVPGDVLETDG